MKNWVCTQDGEYFNLRYIQEIYILEVNVNKFSIGDFTWNGIK